MGFKSLLAQALKSMMAASECYKRSHDGLSQMLQMNSFYELSFKCYNPLECMHTFKMSAEPLSRSLDLYCKKTIHVFPIQFTLVHSVLCAQNGKRRNKEAMKIIPYVLLMPEAFVFYLLKSFSKFSHFQSQTWPPYCKHDSFCTLKYGTTIMKDPLKSRAPLI